MKCGVPTRQSIQSLPLRGQEKDGKKVDLVSTQADFVAFGHGAHACPGRFFAAEVLKLMLAHVVMNYDVKLCGDRPKNLE